MKPARQMRSMSYGAMARLMAALIASQSLLNFDDGTTSQSRSPDHVFEAARDYDVTLRVANEAGESSVTHQIVVTSATGCRLLCSATVPSWGTEGEPVTFDSVVSAEGCEGTIAYQWDFGDGATSTEATTTHTYDTADSYSWSLTVNAGDAVDAGD